MTEVIITKDATGAYKELTVSGHALFAKAGSDIVCSAVSMLTINTINSINSFTADEAKIITADKEKGLIECRLIGADNGNLSHDSLLLMRSYEMGVLELSGNYKEISVDIRQE